MIVMINHEVMVMMVTVKAKIKPMMLMKSMIHIHDHMWKKDNNADDKNLDEVIVGLLEIRVAVCSIWRAVMIMVIIIMTMII